MIAPAEILRALEVLRDPSVIGGQVQCRSQLVAKQSQGLRSARLTVRGGLGSHRLRVLNRRLRDAGTCPLRRAGLCDGECAQRLQSTLQRGDAAGEFSIHDGTPATGEAIPTKAEAELTARRWHDHCLSREGSLT
jgi:hypothetical protein